MPREFHYRWEWRLRSTPQALWPLIADTNRFDRDSGLPPVERVRKPDAADRASGHRVKLSLAGMQIEWDEHPFEWVRPERFGVVREYRSGPVASLRVLVQLEPTTGAGTRLIYEIWTRPRNWLGSLLIPIQAGIIARKKFGETIRRYDELAATPKSHAAKSTFPHPIRLSPGGEARLEVARAVLDHELVPMDLSGRLMSLIKTADDLNLTHMRPYQFADDWGVSRADVLRLFLDATRAGILNLQWDLICPMCRGAQESSTALKGIPQHVHCESCNIDFQVNFDQSVELTFRPNPAVREVVAREYCIGSPMATPHIVAQQSLPPGSQRDLMLPLEAGRYRLRAAPLPGSQSFIVAPDASEKIEFRAAAEGWPNTEPRVSSPASLRLVNATETEQRFLIERMEWTDQAVTAAEVTALQVFRDLFSAEALRPGEQISVGRLTVLFTDLRDSTRLYREIGDAPAFGRVMTHFDVLRNAIAIEEGALVKTIGDAVMAVFRRPVSALKAVLRMQARLREMGAPALTLKAGIHTGACIAVTLNDRLDYFGSTVNVAARVQRFSEGGDVVISDEMRRDNEVSAFLDQSDPPLRIEQFKTELRGFDDESFELWRIGLSAAD